MQYLITGGTGFIGSNFINSLAEQDKVIILSRGKINQQKKNVRTINTLEEVNDNEKIDCIINLAGKSIDCLWTKTAKQELINSRINTTKKLITLIDRLKQKPEVMISASAIGFYGAYNNEVLDEYSIAKQSFTHKLCKEWEDTANLAIKHGVRVCLTRFAVVLGKNQGFIKKTYLPFKLGLGGKIGSGKQIFPWVHIEDVIKSIKYLINNKDSQGAYNIVAPQRTTNSELTKAIGKSLNRPTIFSIPEFFIKLAFQEMGIELLLKGNEIVPKRILDSGYKFNYTKIDNVLKNIYMKDS